MTDRGSSDFEEMLLHDVVTIFLSFSYLFGYIHAVGTVIYFLHDLTDVPVCLAKFLNSTIYKEFSIYVFLAA